MFVQYQYNCRRGAFSIGTVMPYKVTEEGREFWILNFPTEAEWRKPSKLEYIEKGLAELRRAVKSIGLKSIAVPPLGCGLGGLKWSDVRAKTEIFAATLPEVKVMVYEPKGVPTK